MKKKSHVGPILTVAFLLILIGMLALGNWQMRRQSQRIDEVQTVVIENSQTANAVVNFLRSYFIDGQL